MQRPRNSPDLSRPTRMRNTKIHRTREPRVDGNTDSVTFKRKVVYNAKSRLTILPLLRRLVLTHALRHEVDICWPLQLNPRITQSL